nr:chloroplast envelope membrane protein [Microspora sp. UTEX LB472]
MKDIKNNKRQPLSIIYEELGLFPRSFNRVLDRFFKQVFSDVETLVLMEYRFYRYLFLNTLQCFFLLIFVPFLVHFFSKTYFVKPIIEYFWNSQQTEIFLNSHQQKLAFLELHDFEEKLYFESLISKPTSTSQNLPSSPNIYNLSQLSHIKIENKKALRIVSLKASKTKELLENQLIEIPNSVRVFFKPWEVNFSMLDNSLTTQYDLDPFQLKLGGKQKQFSMMQPKSTFFNNSSSKSNFIELAEQNDSLIRFRLDSLTNEQEFTNLEHSKIQSALQKKTNELALRYNAESIEAITNFFADLISFGTLCFLFFRLSIQINITKSFLLEVFFGLDDSKKSLLILFITDLSVGYHSPNIWELFFQFFFFHYGIAESETTIFLLVATLPVLLDVLFKYLIFRHLNRASPATVATYHAMIE